MFLRRAYSRLVTLFAATALTFTACGDLDTGSYPDNYDHSDSEISDMVDSTDTFSPSSSLRDTGDKEVSLPNTHSDPQILEPEVNYWLTIGRKQLDSYIQEYCELLADFSNFCGFNSSLDLEECVAGESLLSWAKLAARNSTETNCARLKIDLDKSVYACTSHHFIELPYNPEENTGGQFILCNFDANECYFTPIPVNCFGYIIDFPCDEENRKRLEEEFADYCTSGFNLLYFQIKIYTLKLTKYL